MEPKIDSYSASEIFDETFEGMFIQDLQGVTIAQMDGPPGPPPVPLDSELGALILLAFSVAYWALRARNIRLADDSAR